MFTNEFDLLDKALINLNVPHDMRYGKSSVGEDDRLFYILNVGDDLEVRLHDNPMKGIIPIMELWRRGENPVKLATAAASQQMVGRIMFNIKGE